ncbi:hypothetical protein PV797_10290 [Clostridiaceae bacterium M8S5]|nr:hypothetical protein PV797_10290 [Clostridiaceae bacterium M8S5]
MKKSIFICSLFVVILVVAFTIQFIDNNSNEESKTSAVAFGIEAKVIDVFDNNCKVIVTGRDQNFSKNDILLQCIMIVFIRN